MSRGVTAADRTAVSHPQDAAAALVQALADAAATVRERPDEPRLLHAALRRVHAALAQLPPPVHLPLPRAAATGPAAPFAVLAAAGLAELQLLADIPPLELARLVRRLAAIGPETPPEDAARLLLAPGLPHVAARARRGDDAEPRSPQRAMAALLPPPLADDAALVALVARDVGGSLPTRVAGLLLADLHLGDDLHLHAFDALLARMTAAGDFAAASWLLQEIDAHGAVGDGPRGELRRRQGARVDDDAVAACFARGEHEPLLALLTHAVLLGDAALARFCRHARAAADPHVRWLAELVGAGVDGRSD